MRQSNQAGQRAFATILSAVVAAERERHQARLASIGRGLGDAGEHHRNARRAGPHLSHAIGREAGDWEERSEAGERQVPAEAPRKQIERPLGVKDARRAPRQRDVDREKAFE